MPQVKRGVAAGRSAQRACERSSDWRRGAAGSPDPDALPANNLAGSPDPDALPANNLAGSPDPDALPANHLAGSPDPDALQSPTRLRRATRTYWLGIGTPCWGGSTASGLATRHGGRV